MTLLPENQHDNDYNVGAVFTLPIKKVFFVYIWAMGGDICGSEVKWCCLRQKPLWLHYPPGHCNGLDTTCMWWGMRFLQFLLQICHHRAQLILHNNKNYDDLSFIYIITFHNNFITTESTFSANIILLLITIYLTHLVSKLTWSLNPQL